MSKDNSKTGQLVTILIIFIIILIAAGLFWFYHEKSKFKPIKQEGSMRITSSAFATGQPIPKTYTCQDQDISPPLTFKDIPESVKSLALILHDPDAPSGDFTHWIMWNIPVSTTEIKASSVPAGAMQGQNDFNKTGYGGPCPPSGTHHYYFELYALDDELNLSEQSLRSDLQAAMKGHVIAQTSLMATFSK